MKVILIIEMKDDNSIKRVNKEKKRKTNNTTHQQQQQKHLDKMQSFMLFNVQCQPLNKLKIFNIKKAFTKLKQSYWFVKCLVTTADDNDMIQPENT